MELHVDLFADHSRESVGADRIGHCRAVGTTLSTASITSGLPTWAHCERDTRPGFPGLVPGLQRSFQLSMDRGIASVTSRTEANGARRIAWRGMIARKDSPEHLRSGNSSGDRSST
jgi:hypothetical protein